MINQKNSELILREIWKEGIFTREDTFESFVQKLCQRFARIYKEIIPCNDYDVIVMKLREKKEI